MENIRPESRGTVWSWLAGKLVYSVGFGVTFLLLVGAGLFYFNGTGKPPVRVVRIAYGAGAPVRKYFLEQMAVHAKKENLDIRLVATEGTDQTLNLMDRNGADLGLISGAIEDRAARNVLEIAPLYEEPLQLLVREELYAPVLKDFGQLRGKSIALDSQSSSTNLLATALLRFIGLTDQVTGKPQYRPLNIPPSQITNLNGASSLPDAIFQVGGVPSLSIRKLIAEHNYRLVPLPFGGAFNFGKFREGETSDQTASGGALRLNRSFVDEFVIPAFVYSVLPPVPPSDTRTVATRLLLVGSDRLDNQMVHRVLDLIFSPEVSDLAKPPLTEDLLNSSFQFERHPGTENYMDSRKPFNLEDALGAYARICEIWGIIAALYFAAVKGLKVWRERKGPPPGTSVVDFLAEILAVEAEAHASCTGDQRIVLDQRLTDIKKRAIGLRVEGRLADADDFPSLLVTLADTRTRIWGPAFEREPS